MQQRFTAAALAVLGLAFGAPARADISARARIDNFGYRLVDLRPDDGIAPAIRFTPEGGSSVSAATFQQAQPYDLRDYETKGNGFGEFQSLGVTAFLPSAAHALARMGGTLRPAPGNFDLVARGALHSRSGEEVLRAFGAYAEPVSPAYGGYEVTPFTKVVFTAFVTLEARRTVQNSDTFLQLASARVNVDFASAPNTREVRELVVELVREPDMQKRLIGRQAFVYENATDQAGAGYIGVFAGAQGEVFRVPGITTRAPVSPVPEPATAALMLCGLGVVAGMAHRARRRGA